MCGLFGFSDPSRSLTPRQTRQLLRALSVSSMIRGTDATGIAYNSHDRLHIYKRPEAANKTLLLPPASARVVMGHVRMTTQGNAQSNYNNHPFPGDLDGHLPGSGPDFALAHNGILNNDLLLRHQLHLPKTQIETDSYIAVQMLTSSGTLDMQVLAGISEQPEGTFTLTPLDKQDNLYFVRGNNPLVWWSFPIQDYLSMPAPRKFCRMLLPAWTFYRRSPSPRSGWKKERFCICLPTGRWKPAPLIPTGCKALSMLPGAGRLPDAQEGHSPKIS